MPSLLICLRRLCNLHSLVLTIPNGAAFVRRRGSLASLPNVDSHSVETAAPPAAIAGCAVFVRRRGSLASLPNVDSHSVETAAPPGCAVVMALPMKQSRIVQKYMAVYSNLQQPSGLILSLVCPRREKRITVAYLKLKLALSPMSSTHSIRGWNQLLWKWEETFCSN